MPDSGGRYGQSLQGGHLGSHAGRFADTAARAAGTPAAFLLCVTAILIWAISGPFFGFSEEWRLVVNTGTTIVTFLMVFLIQNTQNRDGTALQTKLDELIRSSDAEDEFIGIEKLTDKELEELHAKCEIAAKLSQSALHRTHSLREARRLGFQRGQTP